jgi:hypothetical protein
VIGDGWWSWWIPLKGGNVGVGVVFDQRIVDWPHAGGKLGDRLKKFLMQHPVGREMLVDAQFDENDECLDWKSGWPDRVQPIFRPPSRRSPPGIHSKPLPP